MLLPKNERGKILLKCRKCNY
ncbi:MAG: hypothetical protein ACFE7A_06965, partial [Promethearchaeota archaeon]